LCASAEAQTWKPKVLLRSQDFAILGQPLQINLWACEDEQGGKRATAGSADAELSFRNFSHSASTQKGSQFAGSNSLYFTHPA
jgi:hypothetical protein